MSRANAPTTSPAFNASDRVFRRGAAFDQSSSAACSVRATWVAVTARVRSRLTTISVPSRPPSLRLASFMDSPAGSVLSLRRLEMAGDALPACVVVLLQLRRGQRLARGADHLARLEHE